MTVNIHFSWTNHNPDTIYNRMVERLGREPTDDEIRDEVRRILSGEPAPSTPE